MMGHSHKLGKGGQQPVRGLLRSNTFTCASLPIIVPYGQPFVSSAPSSPTVTRPPSLRPLALFSLSPLGAAGSNSPARPHFHPAPGFKPFNRHSPQSGWVLTYLYSPTPMNRSRVAVNRLPIHSLPSAFFASQPESTGSPPLSLCLVAITRTGHPSRVMPGP